MVAVVDDVVSCCKGITGQIDIPTAKVVGFSQVPVAAVARAIQKTSS